MDVIKVDEESREKEKDRHVEEGGKPGVRRQLSGSGILSNLLQRRTGSVDDHP